MTASGVRSVAGRVVSVGHSAMMHGEQPVMVRSAATVIIMMVVFSMFFPFVLVLVIFYMSGGGVFQ